MQWLAVAAAAGALAGPAWNSLLRDVIPADRMGHMYSRRMTLGTVFALVFTLAGGYFVNFWQGRFPAQPLYAYCILFGLGLLFGLIGLAGIVSIPEPQMTSTAGVSIWELLSKPVKDRNFRGLLKYIAAWNFAINIAGPFFIVYLIERIQLDLGMVTVLVVVSQVTNLVFLRIWGRLADRFSNKSVLRVSSPLFLLAILAWTFTTMPDRHVLTLPVLFAIHILSGMAVAGISLASANIAMKLSPNGQAHAYMTAYGIAGAMAGAVAPMLGGMFADFFASRQLSIAIDWAGPGEGLRAYALNLKALDFLFGLAFVLGLIALRFLRKVDESGEADAKVVRDELLSQTFATVRTVSTLPGLRFLVAGPVSAVYKVASTLKNGVAGNGEASGESSDGASPPEEAGQP
jgi:MFS family permease